MGWFFLSQAFSFLLSFVRIIRLPEQDKIVEILILRQQLDILLRQQDKPIRPSRVQKMLLAVLAAKLKEVTNNPANQLNSILRLFKFSGILTGSRVATMALIHLGCSTMNDFLFQPRSSRIYKGIMIPDRPYIHFT